MMDGWTERSQKQPDGTVAVWHERPLPGYPPEAGAVEQVFVDRTLHSTRTRSTRGVTRSRSATAPTVRFSVEISALARDAMVRELDEWDGREQGGALAGRVEDGKLLVERAGGLGIGVPAMRTPTSVHLPLVRLVDFAVSYSCQLVGDWHCHPGGSQPRASSTDERAWQRTRSALGMPAYLGLILAPRRVVAIGLTRWQDEERWSWDRPDVGAYLVTADGCTAITPTLT